MTAGIPTIFIDQFEEGAQHAHQMASRLRRTVRIVRGIEGKSDHIPVMKPTAMSPAKDRQQVQPALVEWRRPRLDISDWSISGLTGVFEDKKTNIRERPNLGKSFMKAVGRQEDQCIIAPMKDLKYQAYDASNLDAEMGVEIKIHPDSVQAANRVFNPARDHFSMARPAVLMSQAYASMIAREVDENSEFFALLPASWYTAFAADPLTVSRDYGPTEVQRTGLKRQMWLHNIELIFMGDRRKTAKDWKNAGEGWSSNGGVGYVWEKESFCIGYQIDPSFEVNYEPLYISTLVTGLLSAGGVNTLPTGAVRIANGPQTAKVL